MDGTPDRTHTAEKCLLDVSVVRTKYLGRKIECHIPSTSQIMILSQTFGASPLCIGIVSPS